MLYREIKNVFEISKYLLQIKNRKYRQILSKIRLSSHQLAIEKGRHINTRLAFKKSLEPLHGVLQLFRKNFYRVLLLHLLKPLFSVFHGLQALSIF